MTLEIRPARPADQPAIRHMVQEARLAPFGLNWPAFLVAETDGTIVGVGQIKTHRDGSQELASLAVVPHFQGQRVGSALVHALLDGISEPVYLFCLEELEGYYNRFQFQRTGPPNLPRAIGRRLSLAHMGMRLLAILTGRRLRIIAMRRLAENTGHIKTGE